MGMLQTVALFILTALAEIVGCYLPYLWLRRGYSIWLLAPAAVSLEMCIRDRFMTSPVMAGNSYEGAIKEVNQLIPMARGK